MTPLLDEVAALLLAIVNRIPLPDAIVRRARLVERLVRRRERLRERLEGRPDDERLKGQLLGVEAALETLTRANENAVPPKDDRT